jgi:hypothetical protein
LIGRFSSKAMAFMSVLLPAPAGPANAQMHPRWLNTAAVLAEVLSAVLAKVLSSYSARAEPAHDP